MIWSINNFFLVQHLKASYFNLPLSVFIKKISTYSFEFVSPILHIDSLYLDLCDFFGFWYITTHTFSNEWRTRVESPLQQNCKSMAFWQCATDSLISNGIHWNPKFITLTKPYKESDCSNKPKLQFLHKSWLLRLLIRYKYCS